MRDLIALEKVLWVLALVCFAFAGYSLYESTRNFQLGNGHLVAAGLFTCAGVYAIVALYKPLADRAAKKHDRE